MAILIICFLVLIFPYASTSITFSLTNIAPNFQDLFNLDGDAYISANGIQVTPENKVPDQKLYRGRASYIEQLHLWDNISGELASFSTSFSFVIDSYPKQKYADGLTFFLAENNAVYAYADALGLPFNNKAKVVTNPFVAVEFDTYSWNEWDNMTAGDHVGININNISSVSYQKWFSDIPNGRECQAWIHYDSDSKNLNVSFTGFQNDKVIRQDGLNFSIDLRRELPEWVIFGFTAAADGVLFQKNNVKSWNFTSSELQVDKKINGTPAANNPESIDQNKGQVPNPRKVKSKIGYLVGLIAGLLSVLVTLLAILAFVLWRKNKNYEDVVEELRFAVEINNEFEMGVTWPRRFTYLELAGSTANFAESKKLGEGGFGGVYKGFLKDSSSYVAVKRVSKTSKQGIKEYASEVRIISRLRHRNLVQLTGWCHQRGELILVYEFMENGSLDLHLFKGKSLLTWGTQYKIARGLASALLYLHEEWEQCVLHRDIKSSNVMLDSNFNTKLGDFGLAKLVDHEKGSKTTLLAGTLGYMAPECIVTSKATKESDVFSFGVVALEIACGRKAIEHATQESQIRLLEWVWELYGIGTLLQAVDPLLESDFEEEEIKRLMMVGLWCVHPDPELRPSMRQVIQVLNSETSPPTLPLKMPVASYMTAARSLLGVSNVNLSKQMALSTSSSYLYGR